MLQIVFSDSECGTLKMATHWGSSSWDVGVIGVIFGEGEKEPTQEEKNQAIAQFKAQREKENRPGTTCGRQSWRCAMPVCWAGHRPHKRP